MVILAAGFEDGETTTIIDVLRRLGDSAFIKARFLYRALKEYKD